MSWSSESSLPISPWIEWQKFAGAVGKKGSIALIERFIGTLNSECTSLILVPFRTRAIRGELSLFTDWYNLHRPHSALHGQTPAEVYNGMKPASQCPRFEPRARWPRSAPCASPHAPVGGNPGAAVQLEVRYQAGRRHLPIVMLDRAA